MANGKTYDYPITDLLHCGLYPFSRDMERDIASIEVVRPERLVYAALEFKARKEGTQFVITEHDVFLDEFADARGLERGTHILINQLEQALHRQSTTARS